MWKPPVRERRGLPTFGGWAEGEGEMTTADWALVISIISAIFAAASFLWNVWSKFIYPKPVVRVSFAMVTIMQRGAEDIEVLQLGATNMGPIEATLMKALMVFNRGPFTDKRYGILNVRPRAPESPDLDYE